MTGTKTAPSRRTLRKKGRAKRAERIQKEPEFRKTFFEGKSKRSTEKKASYRKKKKGKK